MSLALYLLRHATAESGSIDQSDSQRPLSAGGLLDAGRLGEALRDSDVAFDHIWCSSAVRTRQTLEQVAVGGPGEAEYQQKLYHASAEAMLDVLRLTSADANTVLMVGHNPGISQLATALASRGDATLAREVKMGYPPCTCAIYQFDCQTWQEAGPNNSEIVGLWTS